MTSSNRKLLTASHERARQSEGRAHALSDEDDSLPPSVAPILVFHPALSRAPVSPTLTSSSLSSSRRPSRIFFIISAGRLALSASSIAADMKAGGKATLAKKLVRT